MKDDVTKPLPKMLLCPGCHKKCRVLCVEDAEKCQVYCTYECGYKGPHGKTADEAISLHNAICLQPTPEAARDIAANLGKLIHHPCQSQDEDAAVIRAIIAKHYSAGDKT